jgi:3-deoxy-7-phosphoheptulonate synthase
MVIVMSPAAAESELAEVVAAIEGGGGTAFVSRGVARTIVGVVAGEEVLASLDVAGLPGVAEVVRITAPYKLVSRENHAHTTTVHVGGVPIGPDHFTLIAGPCAVETPEQTLAGALMARQAGAALLRGGAFKPRTSPYAFQGMGVEGLKILAEARERTGLPVVTELTDLRDIDAVVEYADCIQVGARNMQHFPLLTELGRAGLPVLLKRGMGASVDDFLLAAEYILTEGNPRVVLCERGIHANATPARSCLDLAAVTVLKEHTHLPVIVDPSHAAGRRALVLPLALAAAACGADGLIVECHPNPAQARCDGPQAITLDTLPDFSSRIRAVARVASGKVEA